MEIATSSTTTTTCSTKTKKLSSKIGPNRNELKYRNITLLRELHPPKWCTRHYTPNEWTLLQWKKIGTTSLSMPSGDDWNPMNYPKACSVSGIRRTSSKSSVLKINFKRVVSRNKKETIMIGIKKTTDDSILSKSVTFDDRLTFRRISWKLVVGRNRFLLLFICTIITLFVSSDVGKIAKLQIVRKLSSSYRATFSRESLMNNIITNGLIELQLKNIAVANDTSLRQKQSIKNQVSFNVPNNSVKRETRHPEIQFGKKSLNGMYYYYF